VAVRRWNSAPLDPSPPPAFQGAAPADPTLLPPVREPSTTEAATTEEDNNNGSNDGEDNDNNNNNNIEPLTSALSETPTGEDDDHSKRGRGWGRGIVRDFQSTVGVSSGERPLSILPRERVANIVFLFSLSLVDILVPGNDEL